MVAGLSKAQKERLKEDGWNRRDIADLEERLDEDEPDDDDTDDKAKRSKRSNGQGRVTVMEGSAAERFLDRLGLDDDDDDDDEEEEPKRSRRSGSRDKERSSRRRGYFE